MKIKLNRYSVSLVYYKNVINGNEILLRVLITSAFSESEALGKAIFYFENETKTFNLNMKSIIKLN
jgi:hypothetical protein